MLRTYDCVASQDHLVVAIVAGKNHVFGAVDDVAVGLLPPPLLQRSFSLAVRSFSRRVRRLSLRAASPSQAMASLFRRFPLLALQRRWVRFRSSCNKRGGDLDSFFLAGQIFSAIVQNSIVVQVFIQFQL